MHIQRLFIYPIKSLLPVEVESALITNAGLEYDRSFVLIRDTAPSKDGVWEHLTIKTLSKLCLFRQIIDTNKATLTVQYAPLGNLVDTINFALEPEDVEELPILSIRYVVEIFGTQAPGWDVGEDAARWFSKYLSMPVRLIFLRKGDVRAIPAPSLIPRKKSRMEEERSQQGRSWLGSLRPNWMNAKAQDIKEELHSQQIRFNDAAPLLITTKASEEDARARLPPAHQSEDIIRRFRTNVHIDTTDADLGAFDEDSWKKLVIHGKVNKHDVELDVVFSTVRCQSINVDFDTGEIVEKDRQLYRLLSKDRRVNSAFPMKPCFGVYAFAAPNGAILSVGDEVQVSERRE